MSFKAGDIVVDFGPEGDLAKCLQPGLDTVLHFKDNLQAITRIPDAMLADVPAGSFRAGFSTDQEAKWVPGSRPQMDYVPQESYAQTAEFVANYHRAREILEAISEIRLRLGDGERRTIRTAVIADVQLSSGSVAHLPASVAGLTLRSGEIKSARD